MISFHIREKGAAPDDFTSAYSAYGPETVVVEADPGIVTVTVAMEDEKSQNISFNMNPDKLLELSMAFAKAARMSIGKG